MSMCRLGEQAGTDIRAGRRGHRRHLRRRHRANRAVKENVEAVEDNAKAYRRTGDRTQLGRFERPVAVAVDAKGRLFVVDSRRGRVQVYVKDPDYEDVRLNV